MLYRNITADVQAYLTHFPSLLITGARQVGKSTLALSLRRLPLAGATLRLQDGRAGCAGSGTGFGTRSLMRCGGIEFNALDKAY
jgi:hypothetical protein